MRNEKDKKKDFGLLKVIISTAIAFSLFILFAYFIYKEVHPILRMAILTINLFLAAFGIHSLMDLFFKKNKGGNIK